MNIALLSHQKKQELMVQFCIAYCGILSQHTICATSTVGRLVSEATGLPIALYLPGSQGGCQQIGARIAYNEIDLVLFLCDPHNTEPAYDVMPIIKLCDEHLVPIATNVATAEVLVCGLASGTLAWRDIVNPKK